jgi:hypothetical protein
MRHEAEGTWMRLRENVLPGAPPLRGNEKYEIHHQQWAFWMEVTQRADTLPLHPFLTFSSVFAQSLVLYGVSGVLSPGLHDNDDEYHSMFICMIFGVSSASARVFNCGKSYHVERCRRSNESIWSFDSAKMLYFKILCLLRPKFVVWFLGEYSSLEDQIQVDPNRKEFLHENRRELRKFKGRSTSLPAYILCLIRCFNWQSIGLSSSYYFSSIDDCSDQITFTFSRLLGGELNQHWFHHWCVFDRIQPMWRNMIAQIEEGRWSSSCVPEDDWAVCGGRDYDLS